MAAVSVFSGAVFFSAVAVAQVEVVESQNRLLGPTPGRVVTTAAVAQPSSTPAAVTTPTSYPAVQLAQADSPSQAGSQVDFYYQLQTLKQEVLELRGMLEEQQYELKRLKQQRLDDYVNLDRRLAAISGGKSVPATDANGGEIRDSGVDRNASLKGGASAGEIAAPGSADEMQSYRSAIDLVLRKKDYDQAIVAFNQYLQDFPQGRYAANCQYWLGEIYLLNGELEQAREWFSKLLGDFPDHNKVPDAMFKLGTVYDKLGDGEKARSLLEQVVAEQGDTDAARLAKNYLNKM